MEQTIFQSLIHNPWIQLTLWILVFLLVTYSFSMREGLIQMVVMAIGVGWFGVSLIYIIDSMDIGFIEPVRKKWWFILGAGGMIVVIQTFLYRTFFFLQIDSFRRKIILGKRAGNAVLKFKKMNRAHDLLIESRSSASPEKKPDPEKILKFSRELRMAAEDTTFNLDYIYTLIRNGANVNGKDPEGLTPLHIAMNRIKFKTAYILFLIGAGADPNERDNNGRTPFSHYAYRYAFRIGDYLAFEILAAYSDMNSRDNDGKVALMYHAGKPGYNRWTFLLIRRGADIQVTDSSGKTLMDYALVGNNRRLIRYLKRKGVTSKK